MKIHTYTSRLFFSSIGLLTVLTSKVFADDSFNSVNYSIPVSGIDPIGNSGNAESGIKALHQVLENIADILLFTIPILAGIALLVAGYFYIFSAGQSDMVGKAKVIIKWNLIAILVAFFSYGIVKIIASFF